MTASRSVPPFVPHAPAPTVAVQDVWAPYVNWNYLWDRMVPSDDAVALDFIRDRVANGRGHGRLGDTSIIHDFVTLLRGFIYGFYWGGRDRLAELELRATGLMVAIACDGLRALHPPPPRWADPACLRVFLARGEQGHFLQSLSADAACGAVGIELLPLPEPLDNAVFKEGGDEHRRLMGIGAAIAEARGLQWRTKYARTPDIDAGALSVECGKTRPERVWRLLAAVGSAVALIPFVADRDVRNSGYLLTRHRAQGAR